MVNNDNGFIVIYRKMLRWEWFQKPDTAHLFIYLLLSANHEGGKWQGCEIKRGQLITGLKKIKQNTGISIQSARTSLLRLKLTHEITIKPTNKFSLITIINYNKYQDKPEKLTSKIAHNLTNKQQTNNKQTTTNNNNKQLNNNKQDNILSVKTDEIYDFSKKIKIMFTDKDRRMNVIAYYWTIKGFTYVDPKSYSAAIKRELKPSGLLVGYTNDQIKKTCEWLKANADFKWTLETVHKYIDEPLENLKAGGKPLTDEDYIKQLKAKNYGKS